MSFITLKHLSKIKMEKIPRVKKRICICPICKKKIITQSKMYFRHCSQFHDVQSNIYTQPTIKIEAEQNLNQTSTIKSNDTLLEVKNSGLSSEEIIKEELEGKNFEMEELEEEEEEETAQEIYSCPICSAKVTLYGDCENCGAEIVWEQ